MHACARRLTVGRSCDGAEVEASAIKIPGSVKEKTKLSEDPPVCLEVEFNVVGVAVKQGIWAAEDDVKKTVSIMLMI